MEDEQKMTKLGTFNENTPRGNSYDSTDIAKQLAAEEAKTETTTEDK